ncbi:heparinase II/III family protein [Pseudalkalibacillus caeni]|uniref:Uncharacterized protein n=1 Tax=Exobacillus caeni TaxID=2574798 RepID=A0A5R9FDP8_9BACL|nr:heparinase II/III-family protein [Pseudalkalibacillus caeni]TLS38684.1 hypothetical protein FCL54_04055 [Pseudalkalibacillus caeni]
MEKTIENVKDRQYIRVFNIYEPLKDKVLRPVCDDILDDIYYKNKRYPATKVNEANMWTANINDRSWRFWLHTLTMIEQLMDGYREYNEPAYMEKAMALFFDWNEHNYPEAESEMAWHDHSTALRLIMICRLFEEWKQDHWDTETLSTFTELASAHCAKLSDPDFYMEKHNHGLDQDIAMYIASRVFNFLPEAEDWYQLATKRFWKQIEDLFAPDGSYLEHSPDYIYDLSDRLFKFLDFLKRYEIKEYEKLEAVLDKLVRFFVYTFQPTGLIPPVGDSANRPINVAKFDNPPAHLLNPLLFVTTGGEKGEIDYKTDAVFPDGGYAIFRNQWGLDAKTVQLFFHSSFHSRVHKHHDDLSINLFGHGQPLLVDAGKYNYDYKTPERQYVVSNKAHNTVVVDNKNTEIIRMNIGKSGLTTYHLNEAFNYVSGIQCLYPGVMHRRMILYVKPGDIIVLDYLLGYKDDHTFEQTFNFDPSLECSVEENRIQAGNNGTPYLSLIPMVNEDTIETSIIKGQEDPLVGWHSTDYATLKESCHSSFSQTGKEARFATHISLSPSSPASIPFKWENDEINLSWQDKNLKIILTKQYEHLVLNGEYIASQKVDHPKITAAIKDQEIYEYREKYRSERQRRLRYQEQLEKAKEKLKAKQ